MSTFYDFIYSIPAIHRLQLQSTFLLWNHRHNLLLSLLASIHTSGFTAKPSTKITNHRRYLFHVLRKSPFWLHLLPHLHLLQRRRRNPLLNLLVCSLMLLQIILMRHLRFNHHYSLLQVLLLSSHSNIFFHLFDQIFCDIIITKFSYLYARISACTGNR